MSDLEPRPIMTRVNRLPVEHRSNAPQSSKTREDWHRFKLADLILPLALGPLLIGIFWTSADHNRLYALAAVQTLGVIVFGALHLRDSENVLKIGDAWAIFGGLVVASIPWVVDPAPSALPLLGFIFCGTLSFDTIFMTLRHSRWWGWFIALESLSYAIFFSLNGHPIWGLAAILFGIGMFDGQRCIQRIFDSLSAARMSSEELAHTDPLTGLHNRRGMGRHLENETAPDAELLCALIDIDNFKQINDEFGYLEGDQTLVNVANRIREILQPDWFVVRSGGDEFMAVSETGSVEQLRFLKDTLGAQTQPAGVRAISVSIGVAVGQINDDLISDATRAVRVSKRRGKNHVVAVGPELRDQLRAERRLTSRLRAAFDNGEIVMWAQTIVDTTRDHIYGYECLARWEQPDGTIIGPEKFISLIEEQGMSSRMGELALRQAANFANRTPLGTKVSVNISASHFLSEGFIAFLDRIVRETGLNPSELIIEITESEHLRNSAASISTAQQVRSRGFGLAVDDFGSGYSSVERLIALPLTHLKLDMLLVQASSDPATQHLLDGLAHYARNAGVTVIGEGVETAGQGAALRNLAIPLQQGYLYSNPAPLSTLLGMHRAASVSPLEHQTDVTDAAVLTRENSTMHRPTSPNPAGFPTPPPTTP